MFYGDWKLTVRALAAAAIAFAMAASVTACSPPKPNADPELASLVQRIGQAEMSRSPEEADMMGLSADAFGGPYASLLDERTMAAVQRARTVRLSLLDELEAIDRTALTREPLRQLDTLLFVFRA